MSLVVDTQIHTCTHILTCKKSYFKKPGTYMLNTGHCVTKVFLLVKAL